MSDGFDVKLKLQKLKDIEKLSKKPIYFNKDYFQYQIPYGKELREMFADKCNFRFFQFDEETMNAVDKFLSSPTLNPGYNKYYCEIKKRDKWLLRDMIIASFYVWLYYKKHPQRFAHDPSNVIPTMLHQMYITYCVKAFLVYKYEFETRSRLRLNENIVENFKNKVLPFYERPLVGRSKKKKGVKWVVNID